MYASADNVVHVVYEYACTCTMNTHAYMCKRIHTRARFNNNDRHFPCIGGYSCGCVLVCVRMRFLVLAVITPAPTHSHSYPKKKTLSNLFSS